MQIRVRRLVVGRRSWRVDAALANRTGVALQVVRPHHLHAVEFGLDVFDTNTLGEVETRAARKALHTGALPERVVPPIAGVLQPGDRWAGSFSAPGRLPRGKYVRVVFGRFVVPGGKVPSGIAARFFCTTDDAAAVTRRRSAYRSLGSLQRDQAVCRACIEAGYPLESLPVVAPANGQRAYLYGQAPGIQEGEERRPWRGRAGKTLRRWLELDEEEFYATFYCASVTRCYPGRAPSGRGDRTPTPEEQRLCAFWREWELR